MQHSRFAATPALAPCVPKRALIISYFCAPFGSFVKPLSEDVTVLQTVDLQTDVFLVTR